MKERFLAYCETCKETQPCEIVELTRLPFFAYENAQAILRCPRGHQFLSEGDGELGKHMEKLYGTRTSREEGFSAES